MLATAQQPSSHPMTSAGPQSHCSLEVKGSFHLRLSQMRLQTYPLDGSEEGVIEEGIKR